MSVDDLTGILSNVATVYLLVMQNRIFKEQNKIFAAQSGTSKMPPDAPTMSFVRRYWPMLTMFVLILANLFATGWNMYDRHHPAVGGGRTSAAPISGGQTKFLLTIGPPDIFISPNGLTGVLIRASIWNLGKPSIATQWSLTVIPRDGLAPVTRDSIPINPAGLRVGGANSGFAVSEDEDISIKTARSKITEAPVSGSVRFYVPLPRTVLENSSIRLSVRDLSGSEFSAVYSPN
jgi:hypothetical protein